MKQTVSLVRAIFLPVLMLLVVTSCTPESVKPNPQIDMCPNLPGVQVSTADCPAVTVPGAPYLNISLKSDNVSIANGDTLWYRSSFSCSFTSDGVVKQDGSGEINNPIVFSSVTAPINFQLSATKTVNGVSSTPTVVVVNNPIRSEHKTNICKGVVWKPDSILKSNILLSPTETPVSYEPMISAEENMLFEYFTNNTYRLTITSGASAGVYDNIHYRFEANDTRLWISNFVGNVKDIESSTPTRLVLTTIQQVVDLNTGQPLQQWRKHKFIYKKV